MKIRVMSDSQGQFDGVELDYVVEDTNIGTKVSFLNEEFTIQQNGKILVLGNPDRVLTLMDVTPEPVLEKPKLVVNETLDVYFGTKEVRVGVECTYKELYDTLRDEWKSIEKIVAEAFPFEYDDRIKSFTFLRGWGFKDGSLEYMREGCFSRKDETGRNI